MRHQVDVLGAPTEKDDRAVVLHRHPEIAGSGGYCSSAFAVASVGVANFAPLVIGATGGSGTRVIARIAKLAGYNLGTKLNSAEDSLAFYSFHETWINPFVSAKRRGQALTPWQSARMKEDFHAALASHIPEAERRGTRWGCKTPRSSCLLPLEDVFPGDYWQAGSDGGDFSAPVRVSRVAKTARTRSATANARRSQSVSPLGRVRPTADRWRKRSTCLRHATAWQARLRQMP